MESFTLKETFFLQSSTLSTRTISEKPWQRLSKEGQLGTVNQEVG
jgi:hypothetical protein